jgi:hypothetical protein
VQFAPCVATTKPLAFRILATTSGPVRAVMKLAGILVAPARMSFWLLSKSNSASPATALFAAEVRVPPEAVTRALKLPARGTNPAASTEILERFGRRSQLSRMETAVADGSACGCPLRLGSVGPEGVEELSAQAASPATIAASATRLSATEIFLMICLLWSVIVL